MDCLRQPKFGLSTDKNAEHLTLFSFPIAGNRDESRRWLCWLAWLSLVPIVHRYQERYRVAKQKAKCLMSLDPLEHLSIFRHRFPFFYRPQSCYGCFYFLLPSLHDPVNQSTTGPTSSAHSFVFRQRFIKHNLNGETPLRIAHILNLCQILCLRPSSSSSILISGRTHFALTVQHLSPLQPVDSP
jgi:hypothetical protein